MPVCCCGVVLAFDLFWFIMVWVEGDVWQNYSKQTDGNPRALLKRCRSLRTYAIAMFEAGPYHRLSTIYS
jgi:hypothetical protein